MLSFAGLFTSFPGLLPPVVPFGLAMAPLIWYHLFFLKKFAGEGISQPAVDSVYYYGFLVTIGALGVTALELSIKGVQGDLTSVAFQFGLGLLATGYAVWARIELTASSRLLDEANLEEAMHRYVERSRDLVSAVELATTSFNIYAENAIEKTKLFASRVEEETQASIDRAAAELKGAVGSMTEESKLALVDLRGLINDTTFGAERDALRSSVTSMVETVNQLSAALAELRGNSAAGAETVGAFAGSLGDVTMHAASAADRLEVLGQKNGKLEHFTDAISMSEQKLNELGLCADVAGASTTSLSDKISMAGDKVIAFGDAAQQGASSINRLENSETALAEFAVQVSSIASSMKEAAKSASSSKGAFDGVIAHLSELQVTIGHLNAGIVDSTGDLKDTMFSTSEALEKEYQKALRQTAELREVLGSRNVSEVANLGAPNGAP